MALGRLRSTGDGDGANKLFTVELCRRNVNDFSVFSVLPVNVVINYSAVQCQFYLNKIERKLIIKKRLHMLRSDNRKEPYTLYY